MSFFIPLAAVLPRAFYTVDITEAGARALPTPDLDLEILFEVAYIETPVRGDQSGWNLRFSPLANIQKSVAIVIAMK